MHVRRLGAGEFEPWRQLRLTALLDAPLAFGSTFARERQHPVSAWKERTAAFAGGDQRVMFVAEDADQWIGCAGAVMDEGVPYVISMWVDPAERGRGIGVELMQAVVGWAHEGGHRRLLLWVTEGNRAAVNLYERIGFQRTGRSQPLPHTPSVLEHEYVVDLAGQSVVALTRRAEPSLDIDT
jgi:GNAT superfamily N-acetyltransferase